MQRVADAIVAILEAKGLTVHMYLDDLVVVTKSRDEADRQYDVVRALLTELGLPEALDKLQPPANKIR